MSKKFRFFLYTAVIMMLFMVSYILFGSHGFLDLITLEKERDVLSEKNKKISEKNLDFYREIDRLKNDPGYIEDLARKELGYIGKDEVVIKSSAENSKHDETQ